MMIFTVLCIKLAALGHFTWARAAVEKLRRGKFCRLMTSLKSISIWTPDANRGPFWHRFGRSKLRHHRLSSHWIQLRPCSERLEPTRTCPWITRSLTWFVLRPIQLAMYFKKGVFLINMVGILEERGYDTVVELLFMKPVQEAICKLNENADEDSKASTPHFPPPALLGGPFGQQRMSSSSSASPVPNRPSNLPNPLMSPLESARMQMAVGSTTICWTRFHTRKSHGICFRVLFGHSAIRLDAYRFSESFFWNVSFRNLSTWLKSIILEVLDDVSINYRRALVRQWAWLRRRPEYHPTSLISTSARIHPTHQRISSISTLPMTNRRCSLAEVVVS